jgi:hypothetical protein
VSIDRADFNEEFVDWLKKLIERLLQDALSRMVSKPQEKDFYTCDEVAAITGNAPYTIREHCRHERINAVKSHSGRGRSKEYRISAAEVKRILNEGWLPLAKH